METDSFFCQLLQQLPQTLFELLGLPLAHANVYRFDSVEVKKSFRIDGLFAPKKAGLPVYFVEVQFRRHPKFYANLFAKVFWYLEANDPNQDWMAVALFASRAAEPKEQRPYEDLLASQRVRRIYLNELAVPEEATLGLRIMHLVSAPVSQTPELVAQILARARREPDRVLGGRAVELVEELLIRRFTQWDREEIRRMFQLDDLRKTRVWQEAHEEGREEGKMLERREIVRTLLTKGKTIKQIAEELDIPAADVRRLARRSDK